MRASATLHMFIINGHGAGYDAAHNVVLLMGGAAIVSHVIGPRLLGGNDGEWQTGRYIGWQPMFAANGWALSQTVCFSPQQPSTVSACCALPALPVSQRYPDVSHRCCNVSSNLRHTSTAQDEQAAGRLHHACACD